MRALGFDPDLHNSGLAIVELNEQREFVVVHAQVISVPKALKGDAAVSAMTDALPGILREPFEQVVVEGQEMYRGRDRNKATPDVLIRLAHIAGAARRAYGDIVPMNNAVIVPPKVWKGQVPKEVKQARICARLGWSYEQRSGWIEPTGCASTSFDIRGKQWSHVLDAIGLAIWKLEQRPA